jgi:hypothetical protein
VAAVGAGWPVRSHHGVGSAAGGSDDGRAAASASASGPLRAHGGTATMAWCSPDEADGVDQSAGSAAEKVGAAGSSSSTYSSSSASGSSGAAATAAIMTVAASCDAEPPGALGSAGAWAGIRAVGCVFRMLSKARVHGRHSVEPGSDEAPQLSHGPTISATVGACERSRASASGRSVTGRRQDGQRVASSTTVVWQWSQYTRLFSGPRLLAWTSVAAPPVASSLPRRPRAAQPSGRPERGCRAATGCEAPCRPRRRRRMPARHRVTLFVTRWSRNDVSPGRVSVFRRWGGSVLTPPRAGRH